MPREKVESSDIPAVYVGIGWASGGSMQVGIETGDDTSVLRQLYGNGPILERVGRRAIEGGWPAEMSPSATGEQIAEVYRQVGHEILNVVEGPLSEVTGRRQDEYRSLWATLNRHAANGLVRYLRKARDSVFGRDE